MFELDEKFIDVLTEMNGKYYAKGLFEGFGAQTKEILNDLLSIIEIFKKVNDCAQDFKKMKLFFARPDLYYDGKNWKILEFNMDTGAAPQSHVAYLQQYFGLRFVDKTGENYCPFVRAWSQVLQKMDGRVVFLGTKDYNDLCDLPDIWLVDEIRKISSTNISFMNYKEWTNSLDLKNTYIVRWLSPYQIQRNIGDLFPAYRRLVENNIDVMPLDSYNVLDSKETLAKLFEYSDDMACSPNERALIKKYIPWTKKFCTDGLSNKEINSIYNDKNEFVIKKMSSHSAKGVYVGLELSKDVWQDVFNKALNTGDCIVQKYVANILKKRTTLVDKNYSEIHRNLNYMVSPFIFNEMIPGTYVRAWDPDSKDINYSTRILGTTGDFLL